MMNRKIVLVVSAATLIGLLRAEAPLNIQVNLGQVPTLIKGEPKQVREPEVSVQSVKQESEKSQPKIEATDLKGRLTAICKKVETFSNDLLDARNKEIETYRTRLFATFEANLKEAQERGDLDAYEEWADRKKRFERLRHFDDWAYLLHALSHWPEQKVDDIWFSKADIQGTGAPIFEELYGDSIKKMCQETNIAAESVQRDAMKLGRIREAIAIREWRTEALSKYFRTVIPAIIEGREGE